MDIFLLILFAIVCILLIGVVLLQKGRGGGLGAAFGGGAGSAFGTRTGDVFTWVTIVLTALFLLLAVVTTLAVRPPVQQVKQPAYSHEPGPISEPIQLTLTPDRGAIVLHYVVDQNREPTRDDDKYTGAIEVQPGQTIRVRAFRAGMDPSETLVLRYEDATQVEPQETPPDEGDETPADETAPAEAETPAEEPGTPAGGQNETPAQGGQGDESPSPEADGENEGDANG